MPNLITTTVTAAGRTGLDLESPVQFAKGVGPYRAQLLAKLGIHRCADLLDYFPRDYVQFLGQLKIAALQHGQLAAIEGEIVQTRPIRRKPRRFEAQLEDDTGRCTLMWFNRLDVAEKIIPGVRIRAQGKVDFYKNRPQMIQPRFELLDHWVHEVSSAEWQPVYPVTAELSSAMVAKIVRENLPVLLPQIAEWFEEGYLRERQLLSCRQAYYLIHQPGAHEDIARARRSLAYHDFFLNQTAVQIKRYHHQQTHSAPVLRTDATVDARIRRLLDFSLTGAQERVVALLRKQLAQNTPLNMLLQGDVGSGKTVVALYAMLVAVASGAQAALLAPTELLAEQHFTTLQRYLTGSRVKIALLTSSVPGATKNSAIAALADGSLGIVVGTHALLQEQVAFKNIAVLVVDEQHKFGVEQRASIRNRYAGVHTMVMTATPIPRTLAMTIFGDLDRALIDELPPGRRPVTTRAVDISRRSEVYEFVHRQLSQGRQAYVVLPAIDENTQDLQSAKQVFDELRTGPFSDFRVDLVHGRLEARQRRRVMEQFRAGKIDLLVSTTVIEVGVDVPNAAVMVIEHAERFGLAQLHQLRGRVGRSSAKSCCILIAAQTDEVSAARLQALIKYSSGFKIAEEDLKLRGMGEMVGTRQSGRTELRFPDLLLDPTLLPMARRDARELINKDPHLIKPEHATIRRLIAEKYADTLALADTA
ncbi:MAG TPA: ATP-dependent DNA helicase RecG [Phycisphaerae bacterium]|nr:ATP-dependent DNA helicase RecG [Phycisphaerae bacterium]